MLMNYYRNMDRSKIQFDFLCNKGKPGAYDEEIKAMGGRIFRTPGLNPLKYPKYLRYMQSLFLKHPDYSIVEAHNGAFGVYALHAAKRNNIPVRIFHAHGASIAKDWKLPLKLLCKEFLPKNMNQHFTCGIAAAACYFPKKIVEGKQYILIPNAIEIDRFRFDDTVRRRIRESNGLTGKHVIGHVGRFSEEKNHSFLIDTFFQIKKKDSAACLVLIGDGHHMDMIQKKAEEMGMTDSIRFLGNIPNVDEWYQAFDVFVLPSFREGLPVVGVEAQAADLPCIFSASITREIGILEKTQFLNLEKGCEYWADMILKALENKERGDVSRIIAASGYDITVEAGKLQELYLKLAGAEQ